MTDEVWNVASWLMTGLVCWLAGLYCMKRTTRPYFNDIARNYFPSALSYAVLFFVFQMLLSIGAYRVWVLTASWPPNSTALALYCATQLSTVIALFVTWQYLYSYSAVIFGGLLLLVPCALSIATAVFFFWAPDNWAMAFAIVYAIFMFIMAIMTIYFAYYGNTHVMRNGCAKFAANQWAQYGPPKGPCDDDDDKRGGGGAYVVAGKRAARDDDGSAEVEDGAGPTNDTARTGAESLLGLELSVTGNDFSTPPKRGGRR